MGDALFTRRLLVAIIAAFTVLGLLTTAASAAPAAVPAAVRPASVCQPDGTGCTAPGDYRNLNELINSDWLGFRVMWTGSAVPSHPSGRWPVAWTAYVTYTNETHATVTFSCADDWPLYATNVQEIMSGGSGDDGFVAASSTSCTERPDLSEPIPPGSQAAFAVTFQNVPWPGSAVTLHLGKIGSSAAAHPFTLTSPVPACTLNPLPDCESLNPKVALDIINWGNQSGCTYTWNVNWGDGKVSKNLVVSEPPAGVNKLVSHTYLAQGTYTITDTGTVTGDCTAASGTHHFTLLAYAALGDSYSAGVGAGAPLPDFENPADCHRSFKGYPELVNAKLGNNPNDVVTPFIFAACNGAKMKDFSTSQGSGIPPQLDVLRESASKNTVGLVTFTISGNDAQFADVMTYCAQRTKRDKSCRTEWGTQVSHDLQAIKTKLPALFAAIKKTPDLAANAKILVLDYPLFFPPGQATACLTGVLGNTFDPGDMAWIDASIISLDGEITKAAKAAKLAPVDISTAFKGHYLCQSSPYLHAAVVLPTSDLYTSFHPTLSGYRVIAQAVEKTLGLG